jgi:uncharacterized protein DUF1918
MQIGKVGDRVAVESERVGQQPRKGEILKVLGNGDTLHYLVRWEDGHESTFFPSAGNAIFSKERQHTAAR